MNFWVTLVAYELVWFAAVTGAGRGLTWPAVLATLLFGAWRLAVSAQRGVELCLVGVALLYGLLLESVCVRTELIRYTTPWPLPEAPAWLLALWVAFALTIVPLFGYLHARPRLAALFGAVGGPLAYLGAARGWNAVILAAPLWRALLALAVGWGIALPLLCSLARHWSRANTDAAPTALRSPS